MLVWYNEHVKLRRHLIKCRLSDLLSRQENEERLRSAMKKFMQEFKEFALRGNVMSLAVGVIVGAAFQEIVTSLTENILSPFIGLLMGQNFDSLELSILGVTLSYGAFITSVVNFIILAFVVFLLVRAMNKLLAIKAEVIEESAPTCPFCMTVLHEDAIRCPACTSKLDEIEMIN